MKKFATVLLAVVLTFSALAFAACQPKGGNNNDNNNVITELTDENIVGTWEFAVTINTKRALKWQKSSDDEGYFDQWLDYYGLTEAELEALSDEDCSFTYSAEQLREILESNSFNNNKPSADADVVTRAKAFSWFLMWTDGLRLKEIAYGSYEFGKNNVLTIRSKDSSMGTFFRIEDNKVYVETPGSSGDETLFAMLENNALVLAKGIYGLNDDPDSEYFFSLTKK